jgi:F-type H+-transporting ATPase subunit epsilon
MAKDFHLSIVAPDRSVVDEPVTSVVAPGAEGYFGIWAGHQPVVASLKAGLLEYSDKNGQRNFIAMGGGFLETDGNHVTILADDAERAQEIDIARAEEALDRARRALRGEESGMTAEQATAEIERAMNRIRIARRG